MKDMTCGPGTALFYIRPSKSLLEDAIILGEHLEGTRSRVYPYHVAVVVSATRQIAGLARGVSERPIPYSPNVLPVHVPVDPAKKDEALRKLRTLIHQQYDWWLVIDDALRIASHKLFGRPCVHLPNKFITSEERKKKICVTVLRRYMQWAGSPVKIPITATPLDAYKALEQYNEQHKS